MSYSEKDFVSTYNRYVDMIYRLCFSFLKNKEDTEDAVQSVFLKYIKTKKRFENEHHEKAWFIVTSSMKRFVKCFFELLTQALVSAVGNGAGKRAQNAPVDI